MYRKAIALSLSSLLSLSAMHNPTSIPPLPRGLLCYFLEEAYSMYLIEHANLQESPANQ